MSSNNIGDRVGAIKCSDNDTVTIFGYGTYVGDEIPPKGVFFLGIELNQLKHLNPKIVLDNGKIVWGCECWWGAESKVKEITKDKKVIVADIDKDRKCQ